MFHNGKHKNPHQAILFTLALTIAALLFFTVGTMAWLRIQRNLVTMTKIQFSTLFLQGEEEGSLPIDLGEINIRSSGEKEMPFRILSEQGAQYILQLGHTTNLPLEYKIYPLAAWDGTKPQEPLSGEYLNRSASALADPDSLEKTYDSSDKVQQNAAPLYWQSGAISSDSGVDYYVLVVSWVGNENIIDKETEMIYLTAGLGGYAGNETTKTTLTE